MKRSTPRALLLACILSAACLVLPACSSAVTTTTGATTQGASAQTTAGQTTASFKGDANLNAPGVTPICKTKVALKIAVNQNAQVEDYKDNYQTKLLETYGNYDLSFDVYPSAEYKQKITLMVTAGGNDLPDVILLNPGDSTVYDWGKANAIIPLNKYYENSSFYLKEAISRTGVDFLPMITSPDGNIYNIPAYNQSLTNEYPAKIWIYQPWLTKLGLKAPTTTEELYTVLKAFKEKDPNGNGKADEVPMASYAGNYFWFEALMDPFQYISAGNDWTVENSKVGVNFNTAGYKEGLHFINKLTSESLLSPLTFTQDNTQFRAMLNDASTIVGVVVGLGNNELAATDPRRAEYVGIAPLKGTNGTQYASWAPSTANPAMMITKTCKNPEAAFRLGDLLVSEEMSIITRWGEKGVDWLAPTATEKSLYDAMGYKPVLKAVLQWGPAQKKDWAQAGPYIRQYSIALGAVWSGNELEIGLMVAKIQNDYTDKHPAQVVTKLIFTQEESNVANEIITNLATYKNESLARFAVGEMDIDKNWDAYIKELDTIGLQKLLPILQTAYTRMNKK